MGAVRRAFSIGIGKRSRKPLLDGFPGSGRSPGEGNGNPLQYSCLENPMNGGAW